MPPLLKYSSVPSKDLLRRFYLYASSLGWVPQPSVDTRGTWNILQSSIITIFFCTATSLHLNIPKERYGDWRRRWTRFCWMTVNTLAPEIFMCIAMAQFLEARDFQQQIARYHRRRGKKGRDWTLMEAFYFNMRAFVYKAPRRHTYGHHHQEDEPKAIKMKHLEAILHFGLLPDVTTDESTIKEYAKQNRLAKSVALVQASWFLVQTFARIGQGLPASPLEITAVAYVAVTFFSWLLWFNKPQDIGLSRTITDPRWEQVFHRTRHRCGERHAGMSSTSSSDLFLHPLKMQLPNIRRPHAHTHALIIGLTWFGTSALFGGLHLPAWRYAFPSAAELWLWRCASIAIVVLPPCFYAWSVFLDRVWGVGVDWFGKGLVVAYLAARMYNLVEVFFSLRQTPPGLYKTVSWTGVWVHW